MSEDAGEFSVTAEFEVNDYMETSVDDVWAIGDIAGNYMFWHSALEEAGQVYRNIVQEGRESVDYSGMGHAIFSSPQVASRGKTEQELDERGREYVIAIYEYSETAMGTALMEDHGFVKALADPDTEEFLGCHVLGPDASTLRGYSQLHLGYSI